MTDTTTTSVDFDPGFEFSDWSLDRVLAWRSGASSDGPLVQFEDDPPISVADLYRRSRGFAQKLFDYGLRPEDRVALFARNSVDHLATWFAANLAGIADAPINPAFSGPLLERALQLLDVETIIADGDLVPVVADVCKSVPRLRRILWLGDIEPTIALPGIQMDRMEEGDPDRFLVHRGKPGDVASILFTSGTSGPAKGVMVTQAQAYLTALQTLQGLRIGPGDTCYFAHPLFHMSPRFCAVYASLLAGANVYFDRKFSANRWLARIRETGATFTIGHGPLLEMIFAEPERPDDANTELTRIGTSPFPKHIAERFERRFGVKGIETWGMTEINIPCWHPFDAPLKAGSCGKIRHEWYDFRVVDPNTDLELPSGCVGEFVVRPKLPWIVSPGYFRNPEATLKAWRNLWFHSGDSGYVDDDGWLYFTDRMGDRIRRRAENISSYDIETAANSHPSVLECAAIGVPSEFSGDDDIKLCLLCPPGVDFDPVTLLEHLASLLPHHMVPRYLEKMDVMPRTPTQKIQKAVLRQAGVSSETWDRKSAGINLREFMATARSVKEAG